MADFNYDKFLEISRKRSAEREQRERKQTIAEAAKYKPRVQKLVKWWAETRRQIRQNLPTVKLPAGAFTPHQVEAWVWVHCLGFTQEITAVMMAKTQVAVSRLLTRFFKYDPSLKPDIRSWGRQTKELPKTKRVPKPGESGSDEWVKEIAQILTDGVTGYHKPGKTWCPEDEDLGQRLRKRYKQMHD